MVTMDILIMIIAATVILGFLVFIHEGGHFLAARAFGVRVSEFMIGLPGPSVGFTWKGTRFGLTAVPLGGYASICGMSSQRSPHAKAVLAYALERGTVVLEEVEEAFDLGEQEAYDALEELAEWGCLMRPHRKDKINIYRTPAREGIPEGEPHVVDDMDAFYEKEQSCQYCMLPFWKRSVILLAGPLMNLLYTIVMFVVIYSLIGVDVQSTVTGEMSHIILSPVDAVVAGFRYIGMVCVAILGLFNPATAMDTVSNSTSIIGIAVMSKDALEAGVVNFLFFSAIISISLGLMNLLPIPPLDGGRFVVEVFQKIARRSVSIRVLNYLSTAGLVLFVGFFLVMVNQDVQRFVFGNWG